MIKKTLFFVFFVGPLLACLMIGTHVWFILNDSYDGPDKTFVVKNGDTFPQINSRLSNEGLISNTRVFHRYAQYKGVLTKFRAGSYTIPRGAKMGDVLETLVFGQPNLTSMTIPEGKNMYEVAKLVSSAGITSEEEFLKAAQNPDLISSLQIEASSLEGYLYPETYKFAPNTPAKEVVKSMVDLFRRKTDGLDWTHPFLNKHQVVILASVVEKETGAKIERPAIAL